MEIEPRSSVLLIPVFCWIKTWASYHTIVFTTHFPKTILKVYLLSLPSGCFQKRLLCQNSWALPVSPSKDKWCNPSQHPWSSTINTNYINHKVLHSLLFVILPLSSSSLILAIFSFFFPWAVCFHVFAVCKMWYFTTTQNTITAQYETHLVGWCCCLCYTCKRLFCMLSCCLHLSAAAAAVTVGNIC
jgi:hypothetical protein